MHSWEGDPRPEPVPEYGTLQPGSGLKLDQSIDPQSGSWRVLFAVAVGILLAAFFATGNARAAFEQITRFLTLQGKPEPASPAVLSDHELESLDRKSPQQQAEALLERAVNHYEGANDQIAARVEGWWGKLKFTPQFNALITTALNSNDLRVRAAGIELDLAAMGAIKSPATIERLALQAGSGPRSQRVWALWELGLLGNRGVEPERVNEILVSQLHDPDPEVRHWAVEGLAYLGTNETIAPSAAGVSRRCFADGPRARRVQPGAVRHAYPGTAPQRDSATARLRRRRLPGRADPRLGLSGAARHHRTDPAQRHGFLEKLVRRQPGVTVSGFQFLVSGSSRP